MIEVATDSQFGMAWDIIDRCRTALLDQGILQWDDLYPTAETVWRHRGQATLFTDLFRHWSGGCHH